jgi:hypothetical protein
VFKRQGLRLDTREFTILRDTFVKGGIRLLVPAMMERELLRHYESQAKECADEWRRLQEKHPIGSLSSWVQRRADDVETECFNELKSKWDHFKSHFTLESLPLVGQLEDVVNWYFAIQAPFAVGKKLKEFPDAFIVSAIDLYHQQHKANIAVVSWDEGIRTACGTRRYVQHFETLEAYATAFAPELTREEYAPEEPIDPTLPIVTEDLTELKGILGRGSQVTEIESKRLIALLQSRGENYRYFFLNATEPSWIPLLEAAGFFANLPNAEQMPDGTTKIPDWPPIYYLEKVFDKEPEAVVRILESLPTTTNPRILERIVAIASKCDTSGLISRLAPKILAAAENPNWSREKFIALLKKLSQW